MTAHNGLVALNGHAPAPPQNLDAELAVLGAVFLSGGSIRLFQAEDLKPEHFYRESHGRIYRAMLDLDERGEPVEELTVIEELRRTKRLDDVGGSATIQLLAGSVPNIGSVTAYARAVIAHARGREVLDLTYRIQETAHNGLDGLDVLTNRLSEVVSAPLAHAERLRRLRMLDVDRMLETDPPPVDWIVHGLLVRGCVTMLAGREGQGKTMLALALASAIGHGAEVAGFRCQPGHVLVIDAENGENEIHRRVQGLGVKKGTISYAETEGFSLTRDLRLVDDVAKDLATDGHRPDVIVLDSFRSLAPGIDENDSGECETVLAPLRTMARAHDCAVFILHHAGKSGGDSYRGSTGIGASVQLGFALARVEEDPEARTRRRLTCWKCRPAPEPATRWLLLESGEGRVLLGEADPFEGDERHAVAPLAERLAECVNRRGALTWAALCQAVGVDPESGSSKRALAEARKARILVKVSHGTYGPPGADGDPSTVRPTGQVAGRFASDSGQPSGQTATWPDDPSSAAGSATVRPASALKRVDGRTVRIEDIDDSTVRPTGQVAGRFASDSGQPSGQTATWPDVFAGVWTHSIDATSVPDDELEAFIAACVDTIGAVEEVTV